EQQLGVQFINRGQVARVCPLGNRRQGSEEIEDSNALDGDEPINVAKDDPNIIIKDNPSTIHDDGPSSTIKDDSSSEYED
ncbi:hypothetical protein V499_01106, partial [Pseudogymnoascus sp. VKM F-103]